MDNLEASTTTRKKPAIKINKKRIFLWCLVYLLLFVFSSMSTTILLFAVVFFVTRMAREISKARKLNIPLPKKVFAIICALFLNLSLIHMLIISLDAPPIPNDYTIADFRSAGSDCEESYEILNDLSGGTGMINESSIAIGLSEGDIEVIYSIYKTFDKGDSSYSINHETISNNEEKIRLIWKKAKRGRSIIDTLNNFQEIADLAKPSMHTNEGFLGNLKTLSNVYGLYISLVSKQSNLAVLREFKNFDSVIRKLSINARSTITKLVCLDILRANARTINFAINSPHTTKESFQFFVSNFEPLTNEHVAMRNQGICEYLMFKEILNVDLVKKFPILSFMRNIPFFKWNSTIRVYRNHCEKWIMNLQESKGETLKQFSVWPSFYPDLGPVERDTGGDFPWYYEYYNRAGTTFLQIMPLLGDVFEKKTITLVTDDLLQIVLNKRLGKGASLKARAYSDKYIINVDKKIIFSPGPDGKAHTKDDIKLAINPQVLNLIE